MALSTKAAPVYGGGTLVIEFAADSPLTEGASYYAVYEGSQQRHVTTARLMTPTKLHSIIPGHHEAEEVKISILCYQGNNNDNNNSTDNADTNNNKVVLATSDFHFHNESAYYLAQFLADTVYHPESLEDLELIKGDQFDLADEELSTLDQRLSRALAHLHFPDFWSVLGPDFQKEDPQPRETVFHFAARLGLSRVAGFFVTKPGCEGALTLRNKNGDTPGDVATANQHHSLATLLSEYNSHGLMPVGRWFETERGLVQTRETGDVTLTSKLQTHHRTVEEDIVVLNGIQRQLEEQETNPALAWQTPWPAAGQSNSTPGDLGDSQSVDAPATDDIVKAIIEKAQELPNLVTVETISDYRDDNNDTYTDANLEANIHMQDGSGVAGDNSEEGVDREVAMDTGQVPRLHVEEGEDETDSNAMEEGISNLHEYNEHLLRIREKSTVFSRLLEQDLRSDQLARFSSSCPALDKEAPLPVIDEAAFPDHHRSMVDLAEDGARPTDDAVTPMSPHPEHPHSPHTHDDLANAADVNVVIKGTTPEGDQGYGLRTQEYDEFLKEFYGGNNPQTRRRSFSPKPGPFLPPGSAQDGDRESTSSAPNMLIHKSVNSVGSEGEGEDTDDDSFRRDTDTSASDSYLSGGTAPGRHRGALYSSGDIEGRGSHGTHNNIKDTIEDGSPDKATMSGRVQPNPARYSADIEQLMRQERHSGSSLEKMSSSTLSRSATTEGDGRALHVPHQKMMKALSTSNIPAATKTEKHGSVFKGLSQDSKHAQFHRQDEIEEEDVPVPPAVAAPLPPPAATRRRKKAEISLYDFLNDPSNFSNDYSTTTGNASKLKEKEKEEKKRKTSVFSRLHSSYRIKKSKDKEGKNKVSHRFVPLSTSNTTTCDICNKPLSNKPALQCEVCLVNVHDSSCKEHVTQCDKGKLKGQAPKQFSTETEPAYNGQDKNASMGVSNLRPSYSFKDNSTSAGGGGRTQSVYTGGASQPLPTSQPPPIQPEVQQDVALRKRRPGLQNASTQLQRRSLPNPRIVIDGSHLDVKSRSNSKSPLRRSNSKSPSRRSNSDKVKSNYLSPSPNPNTGTYLQWRRASAVTVAVDRAIAEEGEGDHTANQSRLDLGHSNITETISHSIESLDEVDSVHDVGYDDVELGSLEVEEPETWSETMDKKALKKMHTKDIKRQDTIWELIHTERLYCKRLKTLEIIFRNAMLRDRFPRATLDRMFPHLDDLVRTHMLFFRNLQELQNRCQDRRIDELGPTLLEQFSGESADRMKLAYGGFCSGHLEAVQLYKDLIAKDRKFLAFIKQRTNHPLCKKREIPDFILLITQRPTKYPILIEAVFKSTKDKKDREMLQRALELSKDVLQKVDEQVAAAERRMRQIDIYNRLESRSFALHRGKKFRKSDIITNGRKLLHEGMIGWKNARGKNVEALAVVLTDVLFFLQENNQKYSFFAQDNKYGVVSLYNLLVREKSDTRDRRGIYLISQNKSAPEMYEIVFNSPTDMKNWAKALRFAVDNCPEGEEEAEAPTEAEEEKRRMEERHAQARAIMEKLREKDEDIRRCCDAKNRLLDQLMAVYIDVDVEQQQSNSRPNSRDFEDTPVESSGTLQAAIQEVSLAATHLTSMLQDPGTSLSRSVSSVGEHASHTFPVITVPKRAETFGGFDNSHEVSRVKHKPGAEEADAGDGEMPQDASDPDLSQYKEDAQSVKQRDSEADSGRGSTPSVRSVMSPVISPSSQEQMNVAHLLKTLNSIAHLTASQGTAVETLRAQLAEANERINKLSADVHEKRGPGYRHNQLEELRNLQGVIQKEKEDWEKKRDKERHALDSEWSQLESQRKELEKQEGDFKKQKEELSKEREKFQRQIDLLRQSGQLPALPVPGGDSTAAAVQSNSDFVPGHRRSASAESFNNSPSDEPKQRPSVTHKDSTRVDNKSLSKLQSFSYSNKANVPEHLLSATNEQKIGSKNVQKLPAKLLVSQQSGSQGDLRKLAPGGASTSAIHNVSGGAGGAQLGSNQSSPSLGQDKADNSHMGHSQSMGQLNSQGQGQGQGSGAGAGSTPLGTSVTVPKGNWQSNRPKQSMAGLGAVMKLSEKSDKKGKSSQSKAAKGASSSPQQQGEQSGERPKSGTAAGKSKEKDKINHKPQKSDSDVIYF